MSESGGEGAQGVDGDDHEGGPDRGRHLIAKRDDQCGDDDEADADADADADQEPDDQCGGDDVDPSAATARSARTGPRCGASRRRQLGRGPGEQRRLGCRWACNVWRRLAKGADAGGVPAPAVRLAERAAAAAYAAGNDVRRGPGR